MHPITDPDVVLALLEQTADKVGIDLRYEPILGATPESMSPGGFCRLRNRKLLIVESSLDAQQKCHVLCDALRQIDLSDVFIPPLIRTLLRQPDPPLSVIRSQ